MRSARLLFLAAALLLAPPALAHAYAGTVRQGESDAHAFDNRPPSKLGDCVALATTWVVTLAYAPPTDVLTLAAGGQAATGRDGVASVAFSAGICTAFDATVTGAGVADAAAYAVSVRSWDNGEPPR